MTSSRAVDGGLADLDPQLAADLVANTGDLAVIVDRTGVIRAVKATDTELRESGIEQWVGQHWAQTVTLETRGKVEALLRDAGSKSSGRRRQVNHLLVSGNDLPVSYTVMRVGRDGAFVAAGRDMRTVSALQQRLVEAQQAMERDYWRLRHVETRYRLLFQLAAEAILVVDSATMKVMDANAAAGKLFGEAPEKLTGRAFPFGITSDDLRIVSDVVANARSVGKSGESLVHLSRGGETCNLSASTFRQDSSTLLLVRFTTVEPDRQLGDSGERSRIAALLEQSPDAFAITEISGTVSYANRAFLDLVQVTSDEQVRGQDIGTWIGRPGADFEVFLTMLRRNGAVRLALTSARGVHGLSTEVEVSAAWLPDSDHPAIGFMLRDVGRRLAAGPQGARDLTRAVEQLTSLVGRVSLRELVRDTDGPGRAAFHRGRPRTDRRQPDLSGRGPRRKPAESVRQASAPPAPRTAPIETTLPGPRVTAVGVRHLANDRFSPHCQEMLTLESVSPRLHSAPRRFPAAGAVLELLKPVTWFPPMWAFSCGVVSSGVPMQGRWWQLRARRRASPGPLVCALQPGRE
ncbi:MAG: transcriptional regulator PpsR [Gemmatimonadaceae bacterium]|nr:transcriptional regulator PpsR [Gemmatimonadaceae bacterium]